MGFSSIKSLLGTFEAMLVVAQALTYMREKCLAFIIFDAGLLLN